MREQYDGQIVKACFLAYGRPHSFVARHFVTLTEEERKLYNVHDGQFLIELSVEDERREFKVFHDDRDPFRWITDSSAIIIDRESVEVIGSIIDEHYF